MNEIIIGIDLGTTNSEVAIVEQGKIKLISDQGKCIFPSVVGIDDNGEIIVGEAAKNQYLLYPERTIKSIKRLMGQAVTVELAGQSYSPQEISAIILKRLKMLAEKQVGKVINKAVITVPAYFSDAQRQATREAGEIAGLDVVRVINEPTAAALAYGVDHSKARQILVYDLGGGTFDVSVVNIEEGVVEVLASHGDNHLGGDDFDQRIIDFLLEHLKCEYDLDLSGNSKVMARLTHAAEQAKFVLSDQPYVQIEEEYLLEHQGMAVHLSVELSRMEYEEMIDELISNTMDAVQIALNGAKIKSTEIDEVLLVGGSTRTPCVRERLLNAFGIEPHSEIDADLCVAMGAATQAAMINGQAVDNVLVDITPYTYGTSAIGLLQGESYPFMFVPIIHKNSVLPNRKAEAFVTHHDGQDHVVVTIYQGEDPDALNNIKIGEFKVEGLRNVKAGNVIILTLELDLNGILHVSAREKATGMEKSIVIENALAGFESRAMDTAKQRISSLFAHMDSALFDSSSKPDERSIEVKKAVDLISKAESLFNQVSNEDREDMASLIDSIHSLIEADDLAGLEEPLAQLNEIIYYLES